ncbi:MAG: glycosyltransferase family A protein, partial [Dehalococcoidia bacterium]|nr:glycosyltransferase family A protein [Dehalococcoidia bacterium]
WPVQLYDPPRVSVIIPVGPGHEGHLRTALDSVQAQTEPGWECIVVNDTGGPLDLEGWPWARVIDTPHGGAGPATARNLGVTQARAPLCAFLDADDYYLPTYLERTMAVQAETGGYVYTDWFQIERDGTFVHKEAGEYEPEHLLEKGLTFTITALLPTKICRETPFDQDAGGWEDWDFFFHLATKGICGVRVPEALFAYRYWSGQRREDGYAQAEVNAKALRRKWHEYVTGGKRLMGCTGCGS